MSIRLDTHSWPTWAAQVASPADPTDYNEAAVERLMKEIMPYIVDVKNVRSQFKAINRIRMIDFETPEDRDYYNKAFERYLAECAKLRDQKNSAFMQLVEWLKFRQAAELCRAPYIASQMYQAAQEGFAPVFAGNFKATIAKVVAVLNERYGVKRELISLIWGGDNIYNAQAKRYTTQEIHDILAAALRGDDLPKNIFRDIKKQLAADSAGLGELDSALQLGPQNFKQRQEEIDRFQSGKSIYCCFSFKSGGVGLSLHHSDEFTKQKVRRKKESNYAVEEDIPLVPIRPRCTLLGPTYSAVELVQGLGRVPRITSLSDTVQILVFYRGTVEELVAATVSAKLKCLKKVVRQNESWEDCILHGYRQPAQQQQQPTPAQLEYNVESEDLLGIDSIPDEDE